MEDPEHESILLIVIQSITNRQNRLVAFIFCLPAPSRRIK